MPAPSLRLLEIAPPSIRGHRAGLGADLLEEEQPADADHAHIAEELEVADVGGKLRLGQHLLINQRISRGRRLGGAQLGRQHGGGGGQIADYQWTYDANSWITQRVDGEGTTTYGYDANGQVTLDGQTAVAGQPYSYGNVESYDANGNRIGFTTIGINNQLLSDGIYNYTYDLDGNRTSRTTIATGEADLSLGLP